MLTGKSLLIVILLISGLVVAFAAGIRLSFLVTDRIATGVSAAGVEVGGLTVDQAEARLTEWSRARLSDELAITADGRRFTGILRDLGVVIDIERMAADAYAIGRKGPVLARTIDGLGVSTLAKREAPPTYRCDPKKLDGIIKKINSTVTTPSRDAKLSFSKGVRTIIPEVSGTTVDPDSARELIVSAIEQGDPAVSLPIELDIPEVTAAELQQVDTLLSSFTTRFAAWRRDRTHNVKLAAAAIDGTLLRSGELFSYNETVGPRLKKTGFKDALIYVKGEIIPGTGGGVCQVSSTVYNAALLANMEIVERSSHSMPVPYVTLGRDATVAYGILDLRFKNTASAPVYIAASVEGSSLTVQVYGSARDKKEVNIITTQPKRIRRNNGKTVTAVTVYRVVKAEDGEVVKEYISNDRYNPAPPPTPQRRAKRAVKPSVTSSHV